MVSNLEFNDNPRLAAQSPDVCGATLDQARSSSLAESCLPRLAAVQGEGACADSANVSSRQDIIRDPDILRSEIQNSLAYFSNQVYPQLMFGNNIGCEVEGFLVNTSDMSLSRAARTLINEVRDEQVIGELGSGQFEINLPALRLTGNCFRQWEKFQNDRLRALMRLGEAYGIAPVMMGILPTLRESDLANDALTQGPRFVLLEEAWKKAFEKQVERSGTVPNLYGFVPQSIAVSSCMSSVQFHMELPADPQLAARRYNAILLATPIVLAAAVGSPFFIDAKGRWKEERVQVWEQLDDLGRGRVFFAKGFVNSPFEVLDSYVNIEPIRLTSAVSNSELSPLQRHIGSIWPFIRLRVEESNWRVETRAFSVQGPRDNIALAALYYAVVLALENDPISENLKSSMKYEDVEQNFYAAAKSGLDAELVMPGRGRVTARELLLDALLPEGKNQLLALGVEANDVAEYLGLMQERISAGSTLADRMRQELAATAAPISDGLQGLVRCMCVRQGEEINVDNIV